MKEKSRRSRSLCGAASAVGAVQPQLAVPEMHGSLFVSPHFDRGASFLLAVSSAGRARKRYLVPHDLRDSGRRPNRLHKQKKKG